MDTKTHPIALGSGDSILKDFNHTSYVISLPFVYAAPFEKYQAGSPAIFSHEYMIYVSNNNDRVRKSVFSRDTVLAVFHTND